MFKSLTSFRSLSLSIKFTVAFVGIALLTLFVMIAIVIPTWEQERLEKENETIERLLANMEHQILLTIHVNTLYNASHWEKMNLGIQNRIHNIIDVWRKHPNQDKKMLSATLEKYFSDFTCNALLLENSHTSYSTQTLLPEDSLLTSAIASPQEQWQVFDKTKHINICPSTDKEYFYIKDIPQSPYKIAIYCLTKEFLKNRTEFEITIGSMLKRSFQNFKQQSSGFAYMMWVDGSDRPCDHNATFRRSYDPQAVNYNTVCCVSESSPTDQPLTGTLKASDYLHAAKEAKPIRHLLAKKDDPSGKLYPALTWVRFFKGNREYPLILSVTLYEEEIYSDLDPIILKFLPASLIALACAFGLGWLLFRRFTCKIDRLLKVAKTIKSGDLKERSNIKGDDDISLLAETFDAMLDTLQENITTLDAKVAKRTLELEHLLSEKEVLLKEIHHRVKNNLAIIIALMQLKEHQAQTQESQALLLELQERIYAIELLHRQLYQSTNLTHIAFETYGAGLIDNMRQTYATAEQGIVLHVKIEPLHLSIDQALACGLLINECITNALKHAFQEEGGEITIIFTCKDNHCCLSINDTGKGLPEDFSLQSETTLGIQLIQGIVHSQLQGSVHYQNDKGAHFNFLFAKE